MFDFDWQVTKKCILPLLFPLALLIGAETLWVSLNIGKLGLQAWGILIIYALVGLTLGRFFKENQSIRSFIANVILILIVVLWTNHYLQRQFYFGPVGLMLGMFYYNVLISFILIVSASVFEAKAYWQKLEELIKQFKR
jgi:hypothetical protein